MNKQVLGCSRPSHKSVVHVTLLWSYLLAAEGTLASPSASVLYNKPLGSILCRTNLSSIVLFWSTFNVIYLLFYVSFDDVFVYMFECETKYDCLSID